MSIGSSKGAMFDDEFHQLVNPWLDNPNSTPDNAEVSPNEIMPQEPTLLPIDLDT